MVIVVALSISCVVGAIATCASSGVWPPTSTPAIFTPGATFPSSIKMSIWSACPVCCGANKGHRQLKHSNTAKTATNALVALEALFDLCCDVDVFMLNSLDPACTCLLGGPIIAHIGYICTYYFVCFTRYDKVYKLSDKCTFSMLIQEGPESSMGAKFQTALMPSCAK